MTSSLQYFEALREQLAVAGPPALELLRGPSGSVDWELLLSGVEAASLLVDDPSVDPDGRALALAVLEEADQSSLLSDTVGELLDIDSLLRDPSADGVDRWLDHCIALAALSPFLRGAVADHVTRVLDEVRARAVSRPGWMQSYADAADVVAAALDLPDSHPVARFLADMSASSLHVHAPDMRAQLSRALERAASEVAPSRLARLAVLLEQRFATAAEWLLGEVQQPVLAVADDGRVQPPPTRLWLFRSEAGELTLVVAGGRALLEWASETELVPQEVQCNGVPLAPTEPLVEGCPCWELATDEVVNVLTLVMADGTTLRVDGRA